MFFWILFWKTARRHSKRRIASALVFGHRLPAKVFLPVASSSGNGFLAPLDLVLPSFSLRAFLAIFLAAGLTLIPLPLERFFGVAFGTAFFFGVAFGTAFFLESAFFLLAFFSLISHVFVSLPLRKHLPSSWVPLFFFHILIINHTNRRGHLGRSGVCILGCRTLFGSTSTSTSALPLLIDNALSIILPSLPSIFLMLARLPLKACWTSRVTMGNSSSLDFLGFMAKFAIFAGRLRLWRFCLSLQILSSLLPQYHFHLEVL